MDIETATATLGGKIESLIKEAEERVYLVSPYVQLQKSDEDQWYSIKETIRKALKRKVKVNVIMRNPEDEAKITRLLNVFSDFDKKNLFIYLIDNLHAKIYYNMQEALITSMNMYQHSAKNNIEIGVYVRSNEPRKLKKIERFIEDLLADVDPIKQEQDIEAEIGILK